MVIYRGAHSIRPRLSAISTSFQIDRIFQSCTYTDNGSLRVCALTLPSGHRMAGSLSDRRELGNISQQRAMHGAQLQC